jgi:Protein of unknown function (DUF2591)
MKIKTSELTGPALDWAVAQAEIHAWAVYDHAVYNDKTLPSRPSEYLRDNDYGAGFTPSTDWAQGGPIIEREGILIQDRLDLTTWACQLARMKELNGVKRYFAMKGATPLIAAMRCYVASKLGDEIEIPDSLAP